MKKRENVYVYVIEDDKSTNELMAYLIRHQGFHPIQIVDGVLKKDTLNNFPPSLFIVDLELPGIRGEDIIDSIRAMNQYDKTPIIIISSNKDITTAYNEHNVNDFLCKPFDVDDFKKKLTALIRFKQ